MTARAPRKTLTRYVLVLALQVPAALLLQSCNKDRQTEAASAGSEDVHQTADGQQSQGGQQKDRAVFGADSTRGRHTSPPPTASTTRAEPAPESSPAQQRARQARQQSTPAPGTEATGRPRTPGVGDPGELSAARSAGGVASNRAPREEQSEPFLRYRPPGSPVGDSGELAARSPDRALSSSTKPVRDLLKRWADTLVAGDLSAHLSLYAPVLERFNGSSNVRKETVRDSKKRLLSRASGLRRFEMEDVRLRSSANGGVLVEFQLESDSRNETLAGSYRLELRPTGGQWRIVREERLQPLSRSRAR